MQCHSQQFSNSMDWGISIKNAVVTHLIFFMYATQVA